MTDGTMVQVGDHIESGFEVGNTEADIGINLFQFLGVDTSWQGDIEPVFLNIGPYFGF